jgi:uncharacterized paraquat-inducible protein A
MNRTKDISEDSFLSFVKTRLEEECDSVPRLAEIERAAAASRTRVTHGIRRAGWWWTASLLAASIAVVCSFSLFRSFTHVEGSTVAQTIELLNAAEREDGALEYVEYDSTADMLLAWQDAPYEMAVASLAASN